MISDVLFEAVEEIDRYMDEDGQVFYASDLGLRLIGLRNRMDTMRRVGAGLVSACVRRSAR